MNWNKPCAYDEDQKRRFHTTARVRLRQLAAALRLPAGSFDLRSNKGGIAVSGEVTLHHERIYVQVSQPAFGGDSGILIRTCHGRRDYVGEASLGPRLAERVGEGSGGGPNHFVSLTTLDDIDALADRVRRIVPDPRGAEAA